MPPKQVKTKGVRRKSEEAEHTHDFKDGDARNKKRIGNLGGHGACSQKNKPALKQGDPGFNGSAPGNGEQAINLASIDIMFSRRLLVRGKAEPRRFSHSKASGSNAVRGPAG
ncbi:hypothetical protein, partial [Thiolapillus sp.]